ncbi:methyltransferase domain-containing protein [Geobacter pickeringii]|uniref:methyltransferase domain-containing protein n=1 Tax=Geobacter pickeringii TaxID=345632 RepID=UPI00068E56F8|nr:class I SAM-dependent methyltransferase [Geobacter pickeringii]
MRSFRDPAGRLHFIGPHLIRQIRAEAAPVYRSLLQGEVLRGLIASGDLIGTEILDGGHTVLAHHCRRQECEPPLAAKEDLFLTHEVIPFPSFPSEWPAEMLKAAASLTLDLAERGLAQGVGLKDASPYNVLFRGPRPVFVDLLSFEPRHPCDPIWLPQAQFLRTFTLPLLAHARLGLPLDSIFLCRRDGLEPMELYRMLGPLRRILPPFLGTVTLPVWLSGRAEAKGSAIYRPRRMGSAEQARFVLGSLFRRLRRDIDRIPTASVKGSAWNDYCRSCCYDESSFAAKSAFVEEFLREARPARVLDVGCNTGHFSRLAAEAGAEVVAIDRDPTVVGALWREARQNGRDILPLVVDFARPTPALGWDYAETPSFLERSRGGFDALLMLALIHHLLVTDRIPLPKLFSLAAQVTRRYLVAEYVPPDDPQFLRIARGHEALHRHLTPEVFEEAAAAHFRILKQTGIGNHGRILYLMEKHNGR